MQKQLLRFGKIIKELRINKGLSLREVCKLIGYDASNWSKVERGRIAPPSDKQILAKCARALGISQKDKKFNEFIDQAQIAQGIIPSDMMMDKDVVQLMPAFFRTLRNKKPTKQEIDRLVELIKNA